jgi:HSP20 family molecular chaperone IbpA
MKRLDEYMEKFQQVATRLNELQIDEETNPLQILRQMQNICDERLLNDIAQFIKMSKETNIFPSFDILNKITPKIVVDDTPKQVIVYCKIAGLDYSSLKVKVMDNNQLIIEGKVSASPLSNRPALKEKFLGKFIEHIDLPASVSSDQMQMLYHKEVLEIHLCKK